MRPGHTVWIPWGFVYTLTTISQPMSFAWVLPVLNEALAKAVGLSTRSALLTGHYKYVQQQAGPENKEKPWCTIVTALEEWLPKVEVEVPKGVNEEAGKASTGDSKEGPKGDSKKDDAKDESKEDAKDESKEEEVDGGLE